MIKTKEKRKTNVPHEDMNGKEVLFETESTLITGTTFHLITTFSVEKKKKVFFRSGYNEEDVSKFSSLTTKFYAHKKIKVLFFFRL